MVNENALRDALVTLAEISKRQYEFSAELAHEIAALRETMRPLDPTFVEIFEKRRKQAAQATAISEKGVLAQYETIIQKMKEGLVS
jgi:hypothetical protein